MHTFYQIYDNTEYHNAMLYSFGFNGYINLISGLKTNPTVWKNFYPNDASMNRVPVIASTFFDFGSPPLQGSQSTTSAPSDNGTSQFQDA
jgi:hypothetical protein